MKKWGNVLTSIKQTLNEQQPGLDTLPDQKMVSTILLDHLYFDNSTHSLWHRFHKLLQRRLYSLPKVLIFHQDFCLNNRFGALTKVLSSTSQ